MIKAIFRGDLIDILSLQDLCRFCQAEEAWVIELVDHGVLAPLDPAAANWRFHGESVSRARKARRLSRDLGVNLAGIALVLDLLEERDAALRRLAQYEAE